MAYIREPTYEISYFFRKVLVPLDGSTSSMKAIEVAIDFAKRYGSKITALIVDDGSIKDIEGIKRIVNEKARKAGITMKIKVENIDTSLQSTPSKIMAEAHEESYDLIILSARGKTANPDLLLGSVALSIIVNTQTSVLLLR